MFDEKRGQEILERWFLRMMTAGTPPSAADLFTELETCVPPYTGKDRRKRHRFGW
jgi:hypothetical protein